MAKASAFDMNALDNRIRELVAYARERDGEDRTTLFRNLVDLFLTGKAPSREPTRTQLLDVLEALIPHVDPETRRTAADLLAGLSEPPMDLVRRISRDRANLVSDLLRRAPFSEDDMISLIETTGREHHQELAARNDLSANVWIALARATPTARANDSQSTLALWRDDLGIKRPSQEFAATITQLHPDTSGRAPARLRILRTDEDLIARAAEGDEDATARDELRLLDQEDVVRDTPRATPIRQIVRELPDPGPGGWAFMSDRDGLIAAVSPKGLQILDIEADDVVGSSLLDLLGLNAKLGHPIARALQRRSAIHDAPLYLSNLDSHHRYWTLEATPLFSPCGGVFEGYEGILTPVMPMEDDEPVRGDTNTAADPLFLDEDESDTPQPRTAAAGLRMQPLARHEADEDAEHRPAVNAETERHVGDTFAMLRAELKHDVPPSRPIDTPAAEQRPVQQQAPAQPQAQAPAPTPEPMTQDDLRATLDTLDDAIRRLSEAARNGKPQLRLQADIAAACAKSLREQLDR
ncbi:PAS domain-containing protein [Gimibacter soli]|uniref:PAS domain-containing protein n=1 Tax=Gimibacter soli TaxID=3024400 RepID=A0AAE9XTW8_9PROT|nr:PAS domain-containing protein [Gimibacter soli]WCL55195.1 PAS domain-containing protein [Gimibacter soli]